MRLLSRLAEQALQRNDSVIRAEALARLAEALSNEGELERALDLAREAVAESEKTDQPMVKVEALFSLGYCHTSLMDFDKAHDNLQNYTGNR